ncbi:hypothetical protein ACWEPM_37810 [Streptomyces sp. NPDC004244]
MNLSTLYAFLANEVLGKALAAILIAGACHIAKKIRSTLRKRNKRTHHTLL